MTGAGTPKTDKSNKGQAHCVTEHAGECLFRDWCRRVPTVFPPSPFLFSTGPRRTRHGGSSFHINGCLPCPLAVVGVASGERSFKTCFFILNEYSTARSLAKMITEILSGSVSRPANNTKFPFNNVC